MLANHVVCCCLFITVLVGVATSQSTLDDDQCLRNAGIFNQTSKQCECLPGRLGVGDLCCPVRTDVDNCYISGDPVMTSVAHQRAALNIPCAICIAVVESKTESGQNCVWEVLSSSTIGKQGAMYNSIIKIGVSINKKSPTYFTLDGKTMTPGDYTGETLSAIRGTTRLVQGEEVVVNYDAEAEFWTIEGCGSKVTFRPEKEGSKKTPGVCIEVQKGAISKPVAEGSLCTLPASFPKTTPWPYKLLELALKTRQMFDNEQSKSHADYDAICRQNIDELMRTTCQGISTEAAQKCGPILYNSVIRSCLYAAGATGPKIASLFGQCLKTFCDGTQEACDAFKSNKELQVCVPSMLDCESWPYFFAV